MTQLSSPSSPPEHPDREPDLDRRGFLTWMLGWTVTAASLLAGGAGILRFLVPNVRYEPSPRLYLEPPDQYPLGMTFLKEHRVFLIRREDGFQALSGVCTHLGCTVGKAESGKGFRCPCHGSRFDGKGKVLKGPAPKALPWLAVSLAPDGRLIVDRSRSVPETRVLKV